MSRPHVPSSPVSCPTPKVEVGAVPVSAQPVSWPRESRPAIARRTLWACAIAANALISGPASAACVISPPGPLDAIPTGANVSCVGTDNTTPLLAAPSSENVVIKVGDGSTPTSLQTLGTSIQVVNSSAVTLDRSAVTTDLTTSGGEASAISTDGPGNRFTLNGSSIKAIGREDGLLPVGIFAVGFGGFLPSGNSITLNGSSITTSSARGIVTSGGSGDSVTLTNSTILTSGKFAQGIRTGICIRMACVGGGKVVLNGTRILTSGENASGIVIQNGELLLNSSKVETLGRSALGIGAKGSITLNGSSISTPGAKMLLGLSGGLTGRLSSIVPASCPRPALAYQFYGHDFLIINRGTITAGQGAAILGE